MKKYKVTFKDGSSVIVHSKEGVEDERLSPMTYKKLKELGYNSEKWKNLTQEQANRIVAQKNTQQGQTKQNVSNKNSSSLSRASKYLWNNSGELNTEKASKYLVNVAKNDGYKYVTEKSFAEVLEDYAEDIKSPEDLMDFYKQLDIEAENDYAKSAIRTNEANNLFKKFKPRTEVSRVAQIKLLNNWAEDDGVKLDQQDLQSSIYGWGANDEEDLLYIYSQIHHTK